MSDDISGSVDKQDYEEFKQKVIGVLALIVQAFDKNTTVTKNSQESMNNLVETIQDLVKLQQADTNKILGTLDEIKKKME